MQVKLGSITKLPNLTTNGFVKTSLGNGTLVIDTTTYLTSLTPWTTDVSFASFTATNVKILSTDSSNYLSIVSPNSLGSENLNNPSFGGAGVYWAKGAGWGTFSGVNAQKNANGTSTLSQSQSVFNSGISALIIGVTYQLQFTISSMTVGDNLTVSISGNTFTNVASANGTYIVKFVCLNSNSLIFTPTVSTSRFNLSAPSIKPYTGALSVGNLYVGSNAYISNQLYITSLFINNDNLIIDSNGTIASQPFTSFTNAYMANGGITFGTDGFTIVEASDGDGCGFQFIGNGTTYCRLGSSLYGSYFYDSNTSANITLDSSGNITLLSYNQVYMSDSAGNSFNIGQYQNNIYVNATDFNITCENSIILVGQYGIHIADYNTDTQTIHFYGIDGSASFANGALSILANGYLNVAGNVSPSVPFSVNNAQTFQVDTSGNATALSFIKTSGTSSQFLKADGSVDSSAYITSSTGLFVNNATNTTLTISGTGPYTLSINLSNTNTWAALQTFGTNISIGGTTATGSTGTGKVVFDASPTLTGTVTFTTLQQAGGSGPNIGSNSISYTAGNTSGSVVSMQVNSLTSGCAYIATSSSNSMTGDLYRATYSGTGSGSTFNSTISNSSASVHNLLLTNIGTGSLVKAGYDTSNYFTIKVSSTGVVTLDAVGSGSSFVFSDLVDASSGLKIPNGSTPTVTALGNIGFDTTSNQLLVGDGTNPVVIGQKIQTKAFVFDAPTGTDTFPLTQFPYAVTITKVTGTVLGGTSLTFNIQSRAAASLNSSGTNIMTSSLVASTTGANTTTFSAASISANAHLVLASSAISGTVGQVVIMIEYTIDRT